MADNQHSQTAGAGGPGSSRISICWRSSPTSTASASPSGSCKAGTLYRLITESERARLIASIAGNLAQVTRKEIIDRSIGHFRRADPEYGARLDQAVETHKRT